MLVCRVDSCVERFEGSAPDLAEQTPGEEVALARHLPGFFGSKTVCIQVLVDLLCHRLHSCRTRCEDEVIRVGGNENSLYTMLYLRRLSFAGLHGDLQTSVVILEGPKTAICRGLVFHGIHSHRRSEVPAIKLSPTASDQNIAEAVVGPDAGSRPEEEGIVTPQCGAERCQKQHVRLSRIMKR